MANIRIKDLSTTAAVTASDDFIAVDGATNGTRKLNAYSPTFGGNLTVSGTSALSGAVKLGSGSAVALGAQAVVVDAGSEMRLQLNSTDRPGIYFTAAGSNLATMRVNSTAFELITTSGTPISISQSTLATTLAGNLTVSGTGTSSVAGTLNVSGGFILNRINAKGIYTGTSDNCGFTWTGTNGEFSTASGSLILKSAGTTALTLDSSQNATFAGSIRQNQANNISLTSGVATTIFSLGTSAGVYIVTATLDVNAVAGYAIVGKGATGSWQVLANSGTQISFSMSTNDLQITQSSGATSTTNTFNLLRLR